jgi:hypothetical protein
VDSDLKYYTNDPRHNGDQANKGEYRPGRSVIAHGRYPTLVRNPGCARDRQHVPVHQPPGRRPMPGFRGCAQGRSAFNLTGQPYRESGRQSLAKAEADDRERQSKWRTRQSGPGSRRGPAPVSSETSFCASHGRVLPPCWLLRSHRVHSRMRGRCALTACRGRSLPTASCTTRTCTCTCTCTSTGAARASTCTGAARASTPSALSDGQG